MTTLAAAIGRALIRWAVKLGRAILERLAKKAGANAVEYFELKSYAWERRRKALLPKVHAAKGKPGRVKLVRQHQAAMRLSRLFMRFATWLRGHLAEITPAAVRAYCAASKAIVDRIPKVSKFEQECQAA